MVDCCIFQSYIAWWVPGGKNVGSRERTGASGVGVLHPPHPRGIKSLQSCFSNKIIARDRLDLATSIFSDKGDGTRACVVHVLHSFVL